MDARFRSCHRGLSRVLSGKAVFSKIGRHLSIINCFKGKGDALECGNYRGLKLLDHVMKIFERVIEQLIWGKG